MDLADTSSSYGSWTETSRHVHEVCPTVQSFVVGAEATICLAHSKVDNVLQRNFSVHNRLPCKENAFRLPLRLPFVTLTILHSLSFQRCIHSISGKPRHQSCGDHLNVRMNIIHSYPISHSSILFASFVYTSGDDIPLLRSIVYYSNLSILFPTCL